MPPHGAAELAHPEPGFYLVGSKSYGRAPTFLMATGYEQVRSVVAEIAGDHAAARDVRLVLPETGVCSSTNAYALAETGVSGVAAAGCCGGPAAAGADACCVKDADAKAAGTWIRDDLWVLSLFGVMPRRPLLSEKSVKPGCMSAGWLTLMVSGKT